MTNSFNTELSEVTASAVKQLSEREKAANAERVVLLEKLRELLKRREGVEERLTKELEEVNRTFVGVVTKVFKGVGEVEKAVWAVDTGA
jgi:predicted phage-related endonuclease